MRKKSQSIIFFILLMMTSSCTMQLDESEFDSIGISPNQSPSSHTSTTVVLDTSSPTLTVSPELALPTATRYIVPGDQREGLIYTPDSLSTPGIFHICSPLARETIEQLREIVSDPYNPPAPKREERHHGVDFSYYRRNDRAGIEGENVHSILPGIVAAVVLDRLPYGNMVIIESQADLLPHTLREELAFDNDKSLYVLYAHMKEVPSVELGQEVDCGQEIGLVGLTGYNVVNPHLHIETRIGVKGVTFDSMVYYDTSAMPEEMENYRRWRTSGDFVHFDPMTLFQFYLDHGEQE